MKVSMIMRTKFWLVLALILSGLLLNKEGRAATITSNTGGTWSDPGTWVGGVVPGTNDDVVIEYGHFVTITSTDTVASLRVRSNGFNVFTINSNVTLRVTGNVTVESTSGAFVSQITLNGNLYVGGNINLNAVSQASKSVIDAGNNANIYLVGNIVFGNAGTIFSSGGSIYNVHYIGSSPQTMTISNTVTYSRVFINNPSGVTMNGSINTANLTGRIEITSGTLNNAGYNITGNTDSLFTIKNGATLNLTGLTNLPAGFDMVLESGSTVAYNGSTQTVAVPNNGQDYYNLQIGCSGSATLAGAITVDNNLTISSGDLDVSASNYALNVGGNWLNSGGTFTSRSGTVTLNGLGAQSVTTNGSNFYNLSISNSSVLGISLNDDATASNSIAFSDGVVATGVNILSITNTSAASISGYSSSSFVYGNLRRYIASNTSTYAFPVGDGYNSSDYQLAEVVNGNMTGVTYITGSFGALNNHNNADMTASDGSMTYLSVANDGVWALTPNAQPGGGSYDIRLYITNFGSQFSDNEFGPLKRDEASTTAADWSDGGGSLNAPNGLGRLVSHGYGFRSGLTSFSEFGMGRASTTGNPLPIQLVSFTATPDDQVVHLNWVTEVEIENDYFTIERSTDGVNYIKIGDVDGAGNSSVTHEYSLIDANPENGEIYYRLRQTDFNGEYTYSPLVSATVNGRKPQTVITVYPNPVSHHEGVSIRMEHVLNDAASVELFDMGTGKLLYQTQINGAITELDLPESVTAGIYLVRVNDGVTISNTKLMVH